MEENAGFSKGSLLDERRGSRIIKQANVENLWGIDVRVDG
jgi:hypothetical protein